MGFVRVVGDNLHTSFCCLIDPCPEGIPQGLSQTGRGNHDANAQKQCGELAESQKHRLAGGEVGFLSKQVWGKCLFEVSLLVITRDYRVPCLR